MERVYIAKYKFCKPGQIRHFQITLPFDALSIIGVEATVRLEGNFNAAHAPAMGLFDMNSNPIVGELRLESVNATNIFYSGDIRLDTAGFAMNDVADGFPGECYSHQSKKEATMINVPVTAAVVYGYFKDCLMANTNEDWPYSVYVYVWYNLGDNKVQSL